MKEKTTIGHNWEALAAHDPMWAILSVPGKEDNKWDKEEFYSTGAIDIQRLMDKLKDKGIDINNGMSLDFGCGMGRLTQGLALFFDKTIGVDISPTMIELANKHNEDSSIDFKLGEYDRLALNNESIDFLYSFIVLQHLNKESILVFVKEFIRVLKIGGVAVFQVPSKCLVSNDEVFESEVITASGTVTIDMNIVPRDELVALIERNGADLLYVENDNASGDKFDSFSYYIRKTVA